MLNLCTQVYQAVIARIKRELGRIREEEGRPLSLLDVGCWDGIFTMQYQSILGGPVSGIEVFEKEMLQARIAGVEAVAVDLEVGRFPWRDESFDVIVANQVFEHLKNVWLPMSEIARVLKPGGRLVYSVPNLASFHNRIMLGAGLQPSSIRTFGPHIRGFTYRQTRDFLEYGAFLRVDRAVGVGFYPFPARLATPVALIWPGASHTPVFIGRRIAASQARIPWRHVNEVEASVAAFTHYEATP